MKRTGDWMQRLTDGLDLPGESLPGQPLVEISGESRVLIENHGGVTAYGREEICVKVKFGSIQIRGSGLELARMTRQQLIVCGKIDAVTLCRRNG